MTAIDASAPLGTYVEIDERAERHYVLSLASEATDAVLPDQPMPFVPEDRVDFLPLPPTPPSACEDCWNGPFAMHFGLPCMSPRSGKWYQRWPEANTYETTWAKLKSRADAGCAWCRFVHGRLKPCRWAKDFLPETKLTITVRGTVRRLDHWYQPESGVEHSGARFYQRLSLFIKPHGDTKTGQSKSLSQPLQATMYVIAVPDDPAASYIVARSSLWDVGSPRALALARQDIDRCVHGHERCKTSFSPNLPSRVVDCTDLARPRLLSSAGECGEYLALSYVWGGDQIHKTTKSNLSAYEQGIAPSLLPATIRDAIYVTNKLGFRWLWVDSLCIVQDSDEDKLHELSHMHDIYRYSHVTILASSAEGAGSGFLQARSPYGGFALPFICPPSPPDPVGVQDDHSELQELQVGQVYLIPGHHGLYTEELACTGTRAWCMQEYILSPRTLVFTPDTLVFRCLTEGFVGVGHSVYMMFGEPKVPESLFLPPAASAPLELDSPEWKKIHVSWTEVVRDYTTRAASFESDKLLACAAVAEAFHRVLGAEYIAGLWRSDSLLFIHWEAERSDMTRSLGCRHTRPTNYRAPSWSWAAIEGPIEYPYPLNARINMPETIRLAEVAECWVTLEDPALPFGRVTDGALVLRGTLIPCRGEIAKFNEDKGHWSVALPSFKPIRRQWQLSLSRGLISDEEMDVYMTKPSDCATVIMDCDVDELPARMWFVPVARSPPTWYDEDHFLFNGIALELAPRSIGSGSEPEEIRFRRIGAFYIRVEVPRPGKDFTEHPVWDRLARAVMDGEPPWTGIVIV